MNAPRRAVLRGILATGASASVPVARGVMASAAHPDAALFALQPAIEAADDAYDQTFEPLARAETAWFAIREKEHERLQIETGVVAARERQRETSDVVYDLRDRIVAIRATTLAGLKFKARYAAKHCEGDPDQEVMDSIVDDLLALGSGEGEARS
jgi:hypothetical protein